MATRKNGVASFSTSENDSLLHWDFDSVNEVVADVREFFPNYATMTTVQRGIVFNGVKQKLQDSIAGLKTPRERYERMQGVYEAMLNGDWTVRGTATSSAGAILVQAIVEVDRRPVGKVREYVKGLKPAQIAALSSHPLYKATVDRMMAEAAAREDVEKLLKGLDDDPDDDEHDFLDEESDRMERGEEDAGAE